MFPMFPMFLLLISIPTILFDRQLMVNDWCNNLINKLNQQVGQKEAERGLGISLNNFGIIIGRRNNRLNNYF